MTIRRRRLPGTHLDLSAIGFGTTAVGGEVDEDQALRLMDAYVELGGNFIDTAEIYSNWVEGVEPSLAEKRIGKWLHSRGLGDQVVVATKGGHPRWGALDRMRLAPEDIHSDIDGSLERLGLDRIPLYYLHRDDPDRPVGEMVDVLAEAVDAGKIAWTGCSNWTADRIRAAQAYADAAGKPRFVIDQMRWSLAHVNREEQRIPGLVEMDDELYAYHEATGMPAAAYSSQAQGFFSGDYGPDVEHPETSHGEKVRRYYYSEANFRRLDRVMALARELGRPPTHVALAYVLSQPFATYALIGTSRLDHLKESCAAGDLELSPEQVARLRGEP